MNHIPPNIERDIELAKWARDKAIPALESAEMMLRGSIRFAELNQSDDQSRYEEDLNHAHNKAKKALEALPEGK